MDTKIKMSNFAMAECIESLSPFLDRKDIIGYAAARNTRYLREASYEFGSTKVEMLSKYGHPVVVDGIETDQIELRKDDPNFDFVLDKLNKLGVVEHEVTIFTITYEDVIDKLSGREILSIDWMLTEPE